jgi:hypothetical protein
MKNLFNQTDVSDIIARIEKLSPDSQRHWGTMSPAQMLAHCRVSLETASGQHVVKPVFFLLRFIGALAKKGALSPKPFGKNSPTDKSYKISGSLDFEKEKAQLFNAIKKFQEGGPGKCTKHPHPFFGHFTPDEWALFEWKHLDHHLRQFGV